MANNLADLTPIIQASALNGVGNRLAFIQDFTTDFSNEYVDFRRSTVKVPLLSGSSATLNPTTFGGGTNGSTILSISMNHVHVPFYISNAEYQNGYKLEQLVESNVQVMADYIQALTFAPLLSTNFGEAVTVAAASFSLSSLQTAWASVKGARKVCYLNGTAFSKILTNSLVVADPMLGLPYAGFQKVAYADVAPAGESNIYGFVSTDKKGLVMASAIPDIAPMARQLIDTTVIDLGNGLSCALNMWGSTSDRSDNASLDLYYGVQVGDKNAIKLIKSS